MAYVAPTLADFRARYQEFVAVPDTLVDLVLSEASRAVSTLWVERDYAPAILLLTAHMLKAGGALEDAAGGSGGYAGPITKERVGEVEITYGNGSGSGGSSDDDGGFGSTFYGRQYLRLMRLNFSGPMIA